LLRGEKTIVAGMEVLVLSGRLVGRKYKEIVFTFRSGTFGAGTTIELHPGKQYKRIISIFVLDNGDTNNVLR
jgi:hypothetical protein